MENLSRIHANWDGSWWFYGVCSCWHDHWKCISWEANMTPLSFLLEDTHIRWEGGTGTHKYYKHLQTSRTKHANSDSRNHVCGMASEKFSPRCLKSSCPRTTFPATRVKKMTDSDVGQKDEKTWPVCWGPMSNRLTKQTLVGAQPSPHCSFARH